MYPKFLLFLLILTKKIHGNCDFYTINSIKKFAEEFVDKMDAVHQLTVNSPAKIETGTISIEQVQFLWNVQELLMETKKNCVGLYEHISMWDDFHELLVKHIRRNRKTESILNQLHTKTYIFYSSVVYFLQQLPELSTKDSQKFGFELFCEGFRVLEDNKLLFGSNSTYVNSTRDLSEYFEEIYKFWEDEKDHNFCGKTPSLRAGLFRYFKAILSIHIRRFIISYFGNAVCNRVTAKRETEIFDKFLDESKTYIRIMKNAIKNLHHYAFHCPPKANERDQESLKIQLEGMIRTKIISEESLSTSRKPCKHNCDLWRIGSELKTDQCTTPLHCQYISSKYDVCVSKNSSRSYEWIRDNDGNIYGASQHSKMHNVCQGQTVTLQSDYRWYNGLYCDYCICTCVEKPRSLKNVITAISFRDQLSDINNNWSVVGVRFVKKNYMIHVQIKEGQLLPYGVINATRWRELESFDYSEENGVFYLLGTPGRSFDTIMNVGRDYGPAETINLDDVMAPRGYLVTGVRFRFAWDNFRAPRRRRGDIQLQIHATKFDFLEGKLLKKSFWIPASLGLKGELVQDDPDDPTKAPEDLQYITSEMKVRFKVSDLRKDAGQSTVPFFDGRDLEFSPWAPLQGLGLFYRGHEGFGGYLAFRGFDLDMSSVFSNS